MGHHAVSVPNDRAARLEKLFGAVAQLAGNVLDTIESDRRRAWQPDDIVALTDTDVIDLIMILARLVAADLVDHDGPGQGYRAK